MPRGGILGPGVVQARGCSAPYRVSTHPQSASWPARSVTRRDPRAADRGTPMILLKAGPLPPMPPLADRYDCRVHMRARLSLIAPRAQRPLTILRLADRGYR